MNEHACEICGAACAMPMRDLIDLPPKDGWRQCAAGDLHFYCEKCSLPEGLKYHCTACKIVIPADAPEVPADLVDCQRVAKAKLTWFNPKETRAAQHIMAAAAWCLIHEAAIKAGHGKACHFRHRVLHDRKGLYADSAVRQGLASHELEAEKQHRRDGWLHAEPKEEKSA
jgi:hypothetical protein